MIDKVEQINELVSLDFKRLDDILRQIVYASCPKTLDCYIQCRKTGTCVNRAVINIQWLGLARDN